MEQRIDYTQPEVWNGLAGHFERDWEARPAAQCGRVTCSPEWSWRPRLHDYDLWFVAAGSGVLRLDTHTFAVQTGTLLCLRPGDTGWATHDASDPLTVVYLHFDFFAPARTARVQVDGTWLPSRYIHMAQAPQFEMLLTRIVALMETPQRLAHLEAKSILQQALLEVYRQDARNQSVATWWRDPALERVMTYVRSHPEQRLTLAQAAGLANLAPDYFSRRFTSAVGLNFRAYCLRTRLERARYLLEETELPIGQVACTLGYPEPFLFSRQFKQMYGYAPRELRRREQRITRSMQE